MKSSIRKGFMDWSKKPNSFKRQNRRKYKKLLKGLRSKYLAWNKEIDLIEPLDLFTFKDDRKQKKAKKNNLIKK